MYERVCKCGYRRGRRGNAQQARRIFCRVRARVRRRLPLLRLRRRREFSRRRGKAFVRYSYHGYRTSGCGRYGDRARFAGARPQRDSHIRDEYGAVRRQRVRSGSVRFYGQAGNVSAVFGQNPPCARAVRRQTRQGDLDKRYGRRAQTDPHVRTQVYRGHGTQDHVSYYGRRFGCVGQYDKSAGSVARAAV